MSIGAGGVVPLYDSEVDLIGYDCGLRGRFPSGWGAAKVFRVVGFEKNRVLFFFDLLDLVFRAEVSFKGIYPVEICVACMALINSNEFVMFPFCVAFTGLGAC